MDCTSVGPRTRQSRSGLGEIWDVSKHLGGTWTRHRCLEAHGVWELVCGLIFLEHEDRGPRQAGIQEVRGEQRVKDFICQAGEGGI